MDGRLAKVLVTPDLTVRQAIKAMDDSGERVLFVVEDGVLLGMVTDGDVRRWVLANRSLAERIDAAMNRHPRSLPPDHTVDQSREMMLALKTECIPIVDETGRITSAVWWMDLFEAEAPEPVTIGVPVVIMAGGEGTRLSPYTKVLPKPLMPIGETPIIELIIERFARYGCDTFHLSLNYKADLIKAYLADVDRSCTVDYVQEDEPLGTAGSLRLLRDRLDGPFFVSNCDVLVEADYSDIWEFHTSNANDLTLVVSMKHYVVPYGVCELGKNGTLHCIQEKPEYNFLVSTGIGVLERAVLDVIPEGRVYHMTDLVNDCAAEGMRVGVFPVSEKCWLDIGQWEELQETLKRFGGT